MSPESVGAVRSGDPAGANVTPKMVNGALEVDAVAWSSLGTTLSSFRAMLRPVKRDPPLKPFRWYSDALKTKKENFKNSRSKIIHQLVCIHGANIYSNDDSSIFSNFNILYTTSVTHHITHHSFILWGWLLRIITEPWTQGRKLPVLEKESLKNAQLLISQKTTSKLRQSINQSRKTIDIKQMVAPPAKSTHQLQSYVVGKTAVNQANQSIDWTKTHNV